MGQIQQAVNSGLSGTAFLLNQSGALDDIRATTKIHKEIRSNEEIRKISNETSTNKIKEIKDNLKNALDKYRPSEDVITDEDLTNEYQSYKTDLEGRANKGIKTISESQREIQNNIRQRNTELLMNSPNTEDRIKGFKRAYFDTANQFEKGPNQIDYERKMRKIHEAEQAINSAKESLEYANFVKQNSKNVKERVKYKPQEHEWTIYENGNNGKVGVISKHDKEENK